MVVDYDVTKYIIYSEDTIAKAVENIIDNKNQIIFSITKKGQLEGLLSNGDILRWLAQNNKPDLSQKVASISNKEFISASPQDRKEKIMGLLEKILYVPLIDEQNHLVAIARRRIAGEGIQIANFTISENSSTFIIAEIGINHNGSLQRAKELIDVAADAGVNCVKFQLRNLKTLYSNAGDTNDIKENLGSQYILDILSRFKLSLTEMKTAFDYSKKKNVLPLCTPWDLESVKVLEEYGMPAYKVASADMTNYELLLAIIETGKPLIISTGMSREQEIIETAKLLRKHGAQYVFLHCNSTYPTAFKDVNLKYMDRLKEIGNCQIGYSGHERGIAVPIAAVARGAKVIEKHITFDRNMEGNDHKVSLLPSEFKEMVAGIRQVEESLGTSDNRMPSQGELMNRATLAKSLVINCSIKKGEEIKSDMLEIKSPGRGLQPNRKEALIGLKAKRNFNNGDFFYPSDLELETIKARPYKFKRHWGIPVRYYDYKAILAKTNPKLLEFHLSYMDIEEDSSQYFDRKYDLDLTVHSPDFFQGDHILNLCSPDKEHRERSIYEVQRVIDVTRKLQPYFTKTGRTLVITSMGGFSKDKFFDQDERKRQYAILVDALKQLDTDGVELIAQTLPPFPWYYGGQSYCNLFMDPYDTAQFCKDNNFRICFDLCHSKLACNQFGWSFSEFIKVVGPYTAHFHISDASGVDGEGVQVGEGDMDFYSIARDMDQYAPKASFIPEIWQGHENEGEGCWIACERLEEMY